MDLSTLRIFIDVVRNGSFSAVAKERNADPSSISRTVASLEKELGVRLLQRTTRQLVPTEAGQFYFERVESLTEELERAGQGAADFANEISGTLRVTTSVSFGLRCIVPRLPEFSRSYPDLTVDLQLSDSLVDLVAEKIDVAIRLGPLRDSSLVAQQLLRTRYSVCASPAYLARNGAPKTPHELDRHNCLRFPFGGFRSRWIFRDVAGKQHEVPVHGNLLISNALGLLECALAGMGLALLPHWLTGEHYQNGSLVRVLQDYDVTATDFNTAISLVYPSRSYTPLKVKAFNEFMRQSLQEWAKI